MGTHGSHLTEEQLETHTIAAWKEGKSKQRRALDNNEGSNPHCFVHVSSPDDCDNFFMYLSCSLSFIVCKLSTFHVLDDSGLSATNVLLYLSLVFLSSFPCGLVLSVMSYFCFIPSLNYSRFVFPLQYLSFCII